MMFGLSRLRAIEIGIALLLTLAALLLFGFRAWTAEAAGIRVSDAWARPTAGQGTTSAAYMTVANESSDDDVLRSASTPKAKSVELHRTSKTAEGVMQMRQVKDGLPIEAGKSLVLEPGGAHFMLIGLEGGLKAGETLPFTLEFARAGAVEIVVPVADKSPADQSAPDHSHH